MGNGGDLPLRFDKMLDVGLDGREPRRPRVPRAQLQILEGDLERVRYKIRKETNEVRKEYYPEARVYLPGVVKQGFADHETIGRRILEIGLQV